MSDILVLEMGLSPGFHVLNAIPPVDLSMSDTWNRDVLESGLSGMLL